MHAPAVIEIQEPENLQPSAYPCTWAPIAFRRKRRPCPCLGRAFHLLSLWNICFWTPAPPLLESSIGYSVQMGYLREKYTAEYYLHQDAAGNVLEYGVAGIEEFNRGSIRNIDFDILERIDFNGKRVLDIGCGRGEAVKYAAEHGAAEVHGVDFSEAAITIASEALRKSGSAAELHCADAVDFLRGWSEQNNSSKTFDVVIMLDCVEHIQRSELSDLLEVLLRLMSPKGLLAVNTPYFGTDNDVVVEGLKPAARDMSDDYEATQGMHCNRYTKRSLRRYLRRHGFGAISHHLFVTHWTFPRILDATRLARRLAAHLKYPIHISRALAPELYTDLKKNRVLEAARPFVRAAWQLVPQFLKPTVKRLMIVALGHPHRP